MWFLPIIRIICRTIRIIYTIIIHIRMDGTTTIPIPTIRIMALTAIMAIAALDMVDITRIIALASKPSQKDSLLPAEQILREEYVPSKRNKKTTRTEGSSELPSFFNILKLIK